MTVWRIFMRKLWLAFVFMLCFIFPVTVQAQVPTPPPSVLQVCLDEKLGTCLERVRQDFGYGGIFLAVFIVAVLIPPVRKKLQELIEKGISINPFARNMGLRRYLKAFIAENRVFGFRGMVDYALKPIDLTNAYIQLDLNFSKLAEKETRKSGEDTSPEKSFVRQVDRIDFNLEQILKAGYKKIAIVGDAGSGKSALLQWAGMTAAQGYLYQGLSTDQKVFLKAIGFNGVFRPYIPLLVPLRKYYASCRENKQPINTNSLHKFICEYSQREYRKENLPDDLFRHILRKGCLVMFDGMDEVEFADRPDVRAAVEGVVADHRNSSRNIYLVTTRPSAAEITSQLIDFDTAIVLPVTSKKRVSIIELWCDAVYPTLTDADNKARDLLRRIENPLVNEMATTPLMINIFALVYYHSRDLPSQRAELFEQAVKALLTDPHKQGQAVSDAELWGGRPANQRFDDMALIAYILHDEGKTSIFADELVSTEVFWKRFGAEKESAQQKASDFLDLVARRGGLLRQDGKSYDFYIRRFREFLAGHYMAQKMEEQWNSVLLKHVHGNGDQWVEPLLLAVGFLAYSNDNKAKKFMRSLIDTARDVDRHDHALAIAGIALADILKNPTEQVKTLFADEKKKLPEMLAGILEKAPPTLAVDLRYRLGLALGEIGDPRFAISPEYGVKVILPDMIPIPGGVFRMGTSEEDEKILKEQEAQSWDDEKPAHDVLLSEYSIGKYPVTNAEFRCFMEQGGYDPQAGWWSVDGRKWRMGTWESDLSWISDEDNRNSIKEWLALRPVERRDRPFWSDDIKWNAANLPVVGISWFEMEAYCNWLSHVTGNNYRLPTEAEWEHAARGAGSFLWAWGNEWDPDKANTDEAEKKIGGTTPVGMYPNGASSYGVQDMIGNVWEWCSDWFNENEYQERLGKEVKDPYGAQTGNARVLRGGAWYGDRGSARCSCRRGLGPGLFHDNIGFRLVCSLSFKALHSDPLNSDSLSSSPLAAGEPQKNN
jgi:formylglycine-generating enzyme required for sulfatase activity